MVFINNLSRILSVVYRNLKSTFSNNMVQKIIKKYNFANKANKKVAGTFKVTAI
jgi:hypothetical protein